MLAATHILFPKIILFCIANYNFTAFDKKKNSLNLLSLACAVSMTKNKGAGIKSELI